MSYIDLLRESAAKSGNIACMGLDPVLEALPGEGSFKERVEAFFSTLFEEMKKKGLSPAAFKPNIGYYVIHDRPREGCFEGSQALSTVLDLLEKNFPGIPVILDAKRGDIAKSSLNYAKEAFDAWGADAVTVSPYMGHDSVLPFAFENKGVYILNRTSNPGAKELQNMLAIDKVDEKENYPFYLAVAHHIAFWASDHEGLGAVVGATNLTELGELMKYFADRTIPTLIPGVGSQGGSAEEVMAAMKNAGYELALARINSSSGLTHPWKTAPVPANWLEMCISSLEKLLSDTSIK